MKLRRRAISPSYWDLVEAFFQARTAFASVYDTYNTRVLAHAAERGVDRRDLRLDAESVSKLLDFGKLESLRNEPLHNLKEIAHVLFRKRASTDKLDRYASEIFHELSILKEEQYKVSTFAPEYHKRNEIDEYESILDEVHKEFPRKVNNIRDLFQKACWRIEAILKTKNREAVFVRSLALFGEKTLEKAYPGGVTDFYWAVYSGGPLEGHLVAARSFAAGGFKPQALSEASRAVAAAALPLPEEASMERDAYRALSEEARRFAASIEGLDAPALVQAFKDEPRMGTESAERALAPFVAPPGSGRYELATESADELDESEAPTTDRDTESPRAGKRS